MCQMLTYMKIKCILASLIVGVLVFNCQITASSTEQCELLDLTEEVGQIYGICPELLQSIIFYESSYRADAECGGCKGLMQINESTHSDRIKRIKAEYRISNNIFNPRLNVLVGADYLAELFEEYEDVGLVLMIYHGESKAIQNADNGKLSSYAKKILIKSEEEEREHGK